MKKFENIKLFGLVLVVFLLISLAIFYFQRSILIENKKHQKDYEILIKKVKKQELEGRVFSKEFKEDLDLLSQVVYELDTKFDGFSSNLSKGETVRDLLQKFNKLLR